MFGIKYIDFYCPKNTADAKEILIKSNNEKVKNDEYNEFFLRENKLNEIFIENEKSEIDILKVLIDKFKLSCNIDEKDVDYIFFCKNPAGIMSESVCIPYLLKENYGFTSATVINMFQECSTTLQAIELSHSMISAGKARNIIILTICQVKSDEDRFIETSILGDGAGIMVLGADNLICSIINSKSAADGSYSLNTYNNKNFKIDHMASLKKGVNKIIELLNESNVVIEDVELFIPQNLNYSGYYLYSKYLNVDLNKFYSKNISIGGHLADVDTIRNLTSVISSGILKKESKFILYSVGNIRPGFDYVCNVALLKLL